MTDLTPTGPLSPSVGDYLKAIWELAETGAASTKQIADRLSVAPASVTNMLGRLREKGLVEYEPYRGALLTHRGREEALRLVRRHRLIETFLLEHLGYSWQEVHEEAERLEHAVSDAFTERLAEYLGHPDHDPHGDPIPAADGTMPPEDSHPLGEAVVGERALVSRVDHRDAAVLAYLEEHGLVPGRLLEVKEVRTLDGVVVVEDEDGDAHALGESLARSILVRQAPERRSAKTTPRS
jgi:DtxR family transcriptional regulator, Mn-dependent transcriptional regulator